VVWLVLAHGVSFVVDFVVVARQRNDRDKNLEILLLRHQVRLLQRRQPRPRLSRWEKLTLTVLAVKLGQRTTGPGRRLDQRTRVTSDRPCGDSRIWRRDVLGSLLHDYYREAA
jgi:hypothetical protein